MKYTDPERNVERRLAGIIRARILRDPCRHCTHRVEGWDHSACMACRTYPACTTALTEPRFELDRATIQEVTDETAIRKSSANSQLADIGEPAER